MNKLLIATLGIYIIYFGSIQFLLYSYRKKKGSNPLNYQLFRIYPKKLIQNEVSRSCNKFYSMSNIISGLFYILILFSLLLGSIYFFYTIILGNDIFKIALAQ